MKIKLILPSLTEAKSAFWRPIKYSLFPPLGLATLAAYLDANDVSHISKPTKIEIKSGAKLNARKKGLYPKKNK